MWWRTIGTIGWRARRVPRLGMALGDFAAKLLDAEPRRLGDDHP